MKHQLGILGALSNVTTLHLSHLKVTLLLNESHAYLPPFMFENLRTLFLDGCHISDDFLGLRQYLRNSPNLHKLSLCRCKVSDSQPTEEVKQRRQSYSQDLAHFQCNNLRLTEIMYRDGDEAFVPPLLVFFIGTGNNLPSNKIGLSEVE
ncbi:uncharacterized protein LOC119313012 isoform X3 [Triticum dicoccoides]|nr:uncharacterized protein LOC119313012 isoform X3 [Triticum dicoccoides]